MSTVYIYFWKHIILCSGELSQNILHLQVPNLQSVKEVKSVTSTTTTVVSFMMSFLGTNTNLLADVPRRQGRTTAKSSSIISRAPPTSPDTTAAGTLVE